jgi:hypothetical protein
MRNSLLADICSPKAINDSELRINNSECLPAFGGQRDGRLQVGWARPTELVIRNY